MIEPSTIARPYAEAVFGLADGAGKLAEWSGMLAALAQVSTDERVRSQIGNPNRSRAEVAGLFVSVLSGKLTVEAENFVRVLADNHRIELLPEIQAQFEMLKNEREGVVEAEVFSAFELDQPQLTALVAKLEQHTGRKVKPSVSIDKALIGGVKIVIGDKVIDGSVRAQLASLENALKA
jgi:F-type H+-transporting ATPase subunit delta